MESMTGFGTSERGNLRIEIRSLNHRFLEINFRMPPVFYPSEPKMRELIRSRFSRGKIDVTLTFLEPPANIKLNRDLLLSILNELNKIYPSGMPNSLPLMINLRDLIVETPVTYDEAELLGCLDEALRAVETMRRQEGESLKREIEERIGTIHLINDKINNQYPEISEGIFNRWKERLLKCIEELQAVTKSRGEARVLSGEVTVASDETVDSLKEGIVRTLSFLLERIDITEEMVRINSHIKQFRDILKGEGPHGKRLDFLVQEILREFNTIGSKMPGSEIKGLVVDAKVELEKLREQIQNIE